MTLYIVDLRADTASTLPIHQSMYWDEGRWPELAGSIDLCTLEPTARAAEDPTSIRVVVSARSIFSRQPGEAVAFAVTSPTLGDAVP